MKNILIIEDDVVFSRSISNWLKKKGMATGHVSTMEICISGMSEAGSVFSLQKIKV